MEKTISFPVINLKGTGSNIEKCRRDAGLSVRDLQTYFGFEYPQAIYKWQHGECLPTVDNLLAEWKTSWSMMTRRSFRFMRAGWHLFTAL